MMFLSNNCSDDEAPQAVSWASRADESTPSASSTMYDSSRPSTAHFSSPGMTRPGSAMSSHEALAECLNDTEIPGNAAALRQKMVLQRQRALQKRTAVSESASSLVMANEGSPTNESSSSSSMAPAGSSPLRPRTAFTSPSPGGSGVGSFGSFEVDGSRMAMMSSNGRSSPPTLESAMSTMSLAEMDASSIVMPEICADTKEAEARRRNLLAQELDERGINPVYDSSPSLVLGGREANFDIGLISQSDMKPFLLNPSPKNAGMIECRIIRERSGLNKLFPKYTLESDIGIFLMTAKKQKHNKTSNYAISMSNTDITKDADSFLGKLRSNFLGLEFVAYGKGLNPKKIDTTMAEVHAMQLARQEMVAVQYSSSLWGGSKPRGPRKMSAVIPRVQPSGERLVCRTLRPETDGLLSLQKSETPSMRVDCYQNKPPKWNEQIGAFVLNFNKRVTQASVKNFQLTNHEDPDTVYLQFGRVGKDVFNMDFRYPFSPFQAFAICLSSFDYKLCCE